MLDMDIVMTAITITILHYYHYYYYYYYIFLLYSYYTYIMIKTCWVNAMVREDFVYRKTVTVVPVYFVISDFR